jgi:hypothetical protein
MESLGTNSCALVTTVNTPWDQIRSGLGIGAENPTFAKSTSITDEQELKTEILRLWQQHEQSKQALGKRLYELQKLLHSPGKKGAGFDAWLKENGIPHSTAYWLLKRHCEREGLAPALSENKTKSKTEVAPSTLSNLGQTGGVDVHAEYVPEPKSISELIGLMARFFETVPDPETRARWASDIHKWLDERFVATGGGCR